MNKRYQIFVSSTFFDLEDERQKVIQALMEMDCIPAGMELFPAADEEQWEFIKKVIDDCDYYLLIIGGRYGSISSDGVSYTEMEYDYAVEKGLKVVALLHESPDELPVSKSELSEDTRSKLDIFREKVGTGRLIKFWNRADQLPGLVALSLTKTIKAFPAIGWVRADQTSSTELLLQINNLRQENDDLRKKAESQQSTSVVPIEELAQGDDAFLARGDSRLSRRDPRRNWQVEVTWNQIFKIIGPDLFQLQSDISCTNILAKNLSTKANAGTYSPELKDETKKAIKIQLIALGLITVEELPIMNGGSAQFWKITKIGKTTLMQLMSIRKQA